MATIRKRISKEAYRNPAIPIRDRVQDLLARMTLEEKIAQMISRWASDVITKEKGITDANCKTRIGLGIGHIARPAVCAGPKGAPKNGGSQPIELVRQLNAIQRFLVRHTRLGIPAIMHEESLSGATMRRATMFPQALNYASTWNPRLIERVAETIRVHMLAVGLRQSLSPLLDVCRDPRWGRTEETFGEDPYLVAAIGCAYVKGLQGSCLMEGVIATGKHFIAYGAPEGGHNVGSVRVGPRELREVHAYPFEAAIRLCGLASVMHAYHEIDGIPCVASRELLTDLLRGELGFEGVTVSDYGALWMLFDAHKISADRADAARSAVYAGLDVEIPDGWGFEPSLQDLIKEGKLPLALIDQAVERILRLKFMLGLFERPYADENKVKNVDFDTPSNRRLAHQAALESIVLIKNEKQVLPLTGSQKIAVVGPNADSVAGLLGDYTYANHTHLSHSGVSVPTVLEAIRGKAPAGSSVLYAKGCDLKEIGEDGFASAMEAARQADVIVAIMGENSFVWSGENRDRTSLSLPGSQRQLLRALREAGKPIVLVLLCGRPLSTLEVEEDCDAIINAWYPGEEGAAAIASILFGETSPSGRLPITIPKDAGHIPCHYSRRPFSAAGKSQDSGGVIRPLYPFGHGLSYTTFKYDNLRISPQRVLPNEQVTIQVDITNTGKRAGVETVQLYLRDPLASLSRPIAELKGFHRVELLPSQKAIISFDLPVELTAFFDPEMNLVVEPGLIEVKIGASVEDIRSKGSFEIIGRTLRLTQRSTFFSSSRGEIKTTGKSRSQSRSKVLKSEISDDAPKEFVEIASRPAPSVHNKPKA